MTGLSFGTVTNRSRKRELPDMEPERTSAAVIQFRGRNKHPTLLAVTDNQCKNILGEVRGGETLMCGKPRARGSYCAECADILLGKKS